MLNMMKVKTMAQNVKVELTTKSKMIIKSLSKLGYDIDFKEAFKIIGVAYRKEVKAIFERQQKRPNVEPWKPLSSPYNELKIRKYGNRPMLIVSGRLKSSMYKYGAKNNISIFRKKSASFGTDVDYSVYVNAIRDFITPSSTSYNTYALILEKFLEKEFKLLGLEVD